MFIQVKPGIAPRADKQNIIMSLSLFSDEGLLFFCLNPSGSKNPLKNFENKGFSLKILLTFLSHRFIIKTNKVEGNPIKVHLSGELW